MIGPRQLEIEDRRRDAGRQDPSRLHHLETAQALSTWKSPVACNESTGQSMVRGQQRLPGPSGSPVRLVYESIVMVDIEIRDWGSRYHDWRRPRGRRVLESDMRIGIRLIIVVDRGQPEAEHSTGSLLTTGFGKRRKIQVSTDAPGGLGPNLLIRNQPTKSGTGTHSSWGSSGASRLDFRGR